MSDTLRTRIAAALAAEYCANAQPCDTCRQSVDDLADAVIRELKLAKACEGGCVWQIPNRCEDMTKEQQKLLKRGR